MNLTIEGEISIIIWLKPHCGTTAGSGVIVHIHGTIIVFIHTDINAVGNECFQDREHENVDLLRLASERAH